MLVSPEFLPRLQALLRLYSLTGCWNYSVSGLTIGYRRFQKSDMKHYNSSGNAERAGYTELYYRLSSACIGTSAPLG
jgi:hypothetical protein